ncbi:oligosaccharide flippase family protein [Fusobacterium mortiferum]|uniref:oligosaccharide flippase family protein n=2 Tax=Fusobacterium mortiferum TaxID=850 RepID=UPI000E4BBF8A|nr:oligosaccharide flippase family protein [Fusobacterium mortiferum]RHF64287.1 flippase [Fusobacterium mortiferum]
MNNGIKKIINNIGWLIFDKIFILLLQFFVGVKIANYYGATLFGQYSYAISLVAFSNIFFELINSRVLKKYYTKNNFNILVFNTNFFKNSIAIILFFIPIIYKFFYKIDDTLFCLLLLLCLDNVLMTATSGIENFFEYKLEAKRIVISNNIVKIISYFLQYICMILNKGIIFIAIVRCIGSLIRVIILKYQYNSSYLGKLENKSVKLDIKLIVKIIDESKYLWFSFVSFLIYTQTDRLMINHYLGVEEVGVYTIGMQLSSILAILIGPIQNSLFPKFLELYRDDYQKYYNFYKLTNTIITQFYLIITLISIIVVKYTFKYVYSSQYDGAILIYSILAFSVFIKANGSLQTSHMTIKNITKKSFYKTLVSLILNIILNILLIPKYGINGAAIATLITQFIALFLIDFFIKEYQEQAIIQLKSLNLIYLIKEIKKYLKKE